MITSRTLPDGKSSAEAIVTPSMRILLLSDWMSNRGGAESYILSLRDELRAQGDEVRLVSCGPRSAEGAADSRAYGSDALAMQAVLQLVNPFAASHVRAVVRDFQPDAAIVSQFAYHLSPAIFRALGRVPTAVTMMDYKAICPTGTRLLPNGSHCTVRRSIACNTNGCVSYAHWLRDAPRYSLINTGLQRATRVLCPSSWMQKELHEAGIDAAVVPLGVTTSSARAGTPSGEPVLAYVGRFSREKGVAVLIAAFAKVLNDFPGARLRLIGDGPLAENLRALAGLLGIAASVEFHGWSSADAVQKHLDDAWCVVCPSLWAEPFGLAAIESLMLGIPVVASDTGGFRETVEHETTGILFRTGDVDSLADALTAVVNGTRFSTHRLSPETIERTAERHGIRSHATRVKGVIRDMLATTLT